MGDAILVQQVVQEVSSPKITYIDTAQVTGGTITASASGYDFIFATVVMLANGYSDIAVMTTVIPKNGPSLSAPKYVYMQVGTNVRVYVYISNISDATRVSSASYDGTTVSIVANMTYLQSTLYTIWGMQL